MPEPTPVPRVIIMKFFIPRAIPYVISPSAAAFASFVTRTGTPNASSKREAIGTVPLQAKLGAFSIFPV